MMPKIAEHFAHPEIKVFDGAESARALGWLEGKGLQALNHSKLRRGALKVSPSTAFSPA